MKRGVFFTNQLDVLIYSSELDSVFEYTNYHTGYNHSGLK